jgi:aminopeptidase N
MYALRPIEYHLTLEPDLHAFTFRGRVTIDGVLESPSREVILDAADLAVESCTVAQSGERCDFALEPAAQRLTVTLPAATTGPLSLTIEYRGTLNDSMAGFYRSRYKSKGEDRYIAVTQFEENDARRALPCQDHPSRKAVFDVEMIVAAGLMAVSNQPIAAESDTGDGRTRMRFERTPPMSTYLLFFGVGAFEAITDTEDPRVRALTVPGLVDRARYALEFGRRSLRWCESAFRTPYPLAKLDLIAVPDFAFGAMENWGAITFRENLMLHYPGATARAEEQRICEVVAHEIAHQWFGDLVSPSDWKYLWLNESFATLFGYRVVDDAHPDWGVWHQFLGGSTEGALARDGMRETPAIEIQGSAPVVINAANAPILYSKGAAVLRQVQGHIGDQGFGGGLELYLRSHANGCAGSGDLWRAFEQAAGGPVTAMMESWIGQPGHPIVTARPGRGGIELSQARFTYLPGRYDQQWVVPVRAALYDREGRSTEVRTLLSETTGRIPVDREPWAYKLNAGQTGFYRCRYADEENLARLEQLASGRKLGIEDRWGLQNDLFALVRSGEIGMERYLAHVEACAEEDDYLPVSSITGNLMHARLALAPAAAARTIAVARALLARALRRTGLEPRGGAHAREPVLTALLRARVLLPAAVCGVPEALAFGAERLADALAGAHARAPLAPDVRAAVLEVAAWAGGAGVMERLLDQHRGAAIEQDRLNALHALACLPRREQLEEVLEFALHEVPPRNKHMLIAGVATNPTALSWIWGWFRGHVGELEKLHRMHQERVISAVVPLGGMDVAGQVESFFESYLRENPALADAVRLALERLAVNLQMRRPAQE